VSIGREVDSPEGYRLAFSAPEILFYWDDINRRSSYPDLIESDGRTLMFVAHKSHCTLSEIPRGYLRRLLRDLPDGSEISLKPFFDHRPDSADGDNRLPFDGFPTVCARSDFWEDLDPVDTRSGFTVLVDFQVHVGGARVVMLDTRGCDERGLALILTEDLRVELVLNDGYGETRWRTDPGTLVIGREQSVAVIVDGGPKIVSFVTNGSFNEGGSARQFGYGMFLPTLRVLGENTSVRLPASEETSVHRVRLYREALLNREAIQLTRPAFALAE
jgi:hypothetical protein